MSGFPRETVISLFSTNAHRVFHLIQAPDNHPFVRWAQESCHAMCWTNARILKQCFKKVVIVRWCVCDSSGWNRKSDGARTLDSDWVHWGNCNLEQDLWSRAAMVLSKPHTCHHSHGGDTVARGEQGEKSEKIEEMKGGRRRMFHIKAPLSYLGSKEHRSRRLQTFHNRCQGMRGMARRAQFFCLVAMASPEAMGRNGSMFCAHLCQHLMGGMGSVGHHPQCELLRAPTRHHPQQKDFTQPERE